LRSFVAFSLSGALALPAVFVACGGAPPSDLLAPPGMKGTTGGDQDGSPADATMSESPDAPSQEPEASEGDDSAVGPSEAGPADAMPVEAAAEAAAPSGLSCTNGTMKVYCQGTDTCCITTGIGTTTAACGSPNTCLGTELRCASSADCPMGQVCCASENLSTFATTYTASCALTCTGLGKSELCNPGKGSGGCSGGETCTSSTALPGYSQCH
jgi:hypothetical protein